MPPWDPWDTENNLWSVDGDQLPAENWSDIMLHLRLGARQIANSDEVHPLLRVMVQSYLP